MDSISLMTMGKITEKTGSGSGSSETIASIIDGETVRINLPIERAISAILGESVDVSGKVNGNNNGIQGEIE